MTTGRLRFGAFLAPHHPLGEHPTPRLRRDLDLAAHLDERRPNVPAAAAAGDGGA